MSFDGGNSRIGRSDPFATPVEERDPARRLRGRLAAPVTIWTAYDNDGGPAGMTMSSVLIVEGSPPELLGLVDPLSALWKAMNETRRFVVHVVAADQVESARNFALQRPVDPFEGVALTTTTWGPALAHVATRAGCVLTQADEAGYSFLVRARIEEIHVDDTVSRPLIYHRGLYLSSGQLRE